MNKFLKYSIIPIGIIAVIIPTLLILDNTGGNSEPMVTSDDLQVLSKEDKYLKDLHPKIVINLVNGLTQYYDKKGLENLRNANYIAQLSGGTDGTRYLYIYDPDTNQFLGKHDNHPVGEFFITQSNLDEGQSIWETFTKDTIPSPYNVYFKNHDGLVFASYYKAD